MERGSRAAAGPFLDFVPVFPRTTRRYVDTIPSQGADHESNYRLDAEQLVRIRKPARSVNDCVYRSVVRKQDFERHARHAAAIRRVAPPFDDERPGRALERESEGAQI